MRYTEETYEGQEQILAGVDGIRSPVHVTMDPALMTADADGHKQADPGFFVAGTRAAGRALPRTNMRADAATTDTVLQVDKSQYFVAGDEVYIVPASAQIDLSGAWAVGSTLTITVAGLDFVYTSTTTDIATVASEAAAAFNANPATRRLAQAIASATALTIVAKDFATPHAIAIAATGGTAAINGGLLLLTPFRLLGTVDTNGVDVANNTLALTATAGAAVAAGVPVGTADEVIGVFIRSLDLINQPCGIGVYTSVSAIRGALPYLDSGLEAEFVEIQAV